jgi:hypothetical protein
MNTARKQQLDTMVSRLSQLSGWRLEWRIEHDPFAQLVLEQPGNPGSRVALALDPCDLLREVLTHPRRMSRPVTLEMTQEEWDAVTAALQDAMRKPPAIMVVMHDCPDCASLCDAAQMN